MMCSLGPFRGAAPQRPRQIDELPRRLALSRVSVGEQHGRCFVLSASGCDADIEDRQR